MQKPNNFENVSLGEFTPIELGGHLAIIKKLEETHSKAGRPMIKVAFDFDSSDIQPGYFMDSYKKDTREDKKWPFQGTHYILTEDNDGKCSRTFKSFITSVENSNNTEVVWGEGFSKFFTGKKIGVVFGEQEEEYNGEVKVRRRLRYMCDYNKAKDANVPDKKFLNNQNYWSDKKNNDDGDDGETIPF